MRSILVMTCVAFAFAITGCYSEEAGQRYIANLEKKPGDGKGAKYWVGKIGDPAETSDAFKYLVELKDKSAVPALVKAFNNEKNKSYRGDIAMVLAELGDKSVVETLINGVSFEVSEKIDQQQVNDRTNEKIATALAKLGDPAAKSVLVKLLDAKAANVIAAAVRAQLVFKDPDAVPRIAEIIKKDHLARNIRGESVKVLGEIGAPAAVPAIPAIVRAMFVEKGGTIYPEASYTLAQIGPASAPELIRTLQRKNKDVEDLGKNFIVGAIEAKAADTLGWICDKSAYEPMAEMLRKFVKEGDNPIATAKTAFAIARLQDLRAVGIIIKFVEDEEDPSVRQHYTLALNMLGDRSATKVLIKASKKPDIDKYKKEGAVEMELNILRESRNDVVRAAARLGNGKDLADYQKMASGEKDPKVQTVMKDYQVMLETARDCEEKLDCWIGKLNDQNKLVREKAAYEIGRIGGDQACDALIKLIDDKEQAVQFASMQGIYNLAEKNGAKLLAMFDAKVGSMDKNKAEKMKEDLKMMKLRLQKAAGK